MNAPVRLLKTAARNIAKLTLASLIDPLATRPPELFLPSQFQQFVDQYQAASIEERRGRSLQLLSKIAIDPHCADFVLQPLFARKFDNSDYFHHAVIAANYSLGLLDRAREEAANLYERNPMPFNAWLLARCLRAGGLTADAVALLQAAHARWPADTDVAMELASQLYWLGNTAEANAVIERVPTSAIPFADIGALKRELAAAIKGEANLRTGGGDIYDDKMVTETWWRYWRYFNQFSERQHNEPFVMEAILRRLSAVIQKNPPKTVIDFGALCGEINFRLAYRFPGVHVCGVDRQTIIKRLNDEAYSLPNLSFRDGDIFESLKDLSDPPTLFTHTRTTVLCYPDFVQRLYEDCYAKGVQTIVGFEPSGISRDTMRFPDYGNMPESVAFRSVMMLHNYPKMLAQAGYRITKSEMVPVSFLYFDDPGYHLFYFEAERVT